ncbi:hypothetical protein FACS189472_16600 [Alphaproteobacteria bacterium]|nr:hypothetical protein FACS189472_16600 [Alphaproteobacteria bacterium]
MLQTIERKVEHRTAQVVHHCEESIQAVKEEMRTMKEELEGKMLVMNEGWERRIKEEMDGLRNEFSEK